MTKDQASSSSLSDNSISISQLKDKFSKSKTSNEIYRCLLNDFYSFDHYNTKWILASLSSSIGLKRLELCRDLKMKMLTSYFEIPDNPLHYNILNKELMTMNAPAIHPLASLYLNPMGMAIYMRNESALRTILKMNINNFSDPCFVQKWWRKGEDRFFTDFSTINVLALAVRRNFMKGVSIMMEWDLNPKGHIFHVDHIQSVNSCKTHVYQDGLYLAFDILHERPGFDIGKYFKIIVDRRKINNYKIISYEMNTIIKYQDHRTVEKVRLSSLFRIILKRAVQSSSYKVSSKYLSILEIIQAKGFFRYLQCTLKHVKNGQELLHNDHKQFCEEIFYLGDEMESQKIYRDDLEKLPYFSKIGCLLLDRTICLGHLILWLTETKKRERQHLKNKLSQLMLIILIESNIIIWFLQTANNIISEFFNFPCCKVGPIKEEDIFVCKTIILQNLQQNNVLKANIYKKMSKLSSTFFPLNSQKHCRKKKNIYKPDYLVCNSHTIQSWNHPNNKCQLKLSRYYKSEEVPILSLKYKLGKTDPSLKILNDSQKTYSSESTNTELGYKSFYSDANSLDSVEEIAYSKQDLFTKYFPPPLVISKQRTQFVNSVKVSKSFTTECSIAHSSPRTSYGNESSLIDDINENYLS